MKSVVAVVLALCVAFVASQSASTNPTGAVYFFPSTELKLNSTVTSTLFNTTGNYYADFYRVWVPSYVQSVEYIVTNNQTDYYTSYVDFYINFVVSGQDSTFGYSCSGNNGNEFNSPCDYADDYFYTSSGSGVNSEIYYAGQDYAPGRWQYITIVKENYNTGNYTVYTLTAKANTYCSSNTSVVVLDYSATTCAVSTSVNNITASGQTVTAQSVSGEGDFDAFLIQVPQNVTRVWGFVSADDDNLYFLAAANYIPIYSGYSSTYTTYGYYNSTTSKYNFFLQYDLPNNNQPLYFAVTPYYSTGTVNYDVQFFWTACDAAHAGFGNLYVDVYEMTTSYEDQPDCQYPIVFNNVNLLTSLTTTTWTVAPYNSTTDYSVGYHASYAVVNVPAATVGSLNFTCNATNTAFVAFSLNQMTVCDDYLFRLDCVGGSYATGDLQTLLSHDLYPGGWWSVAACNPNSGNSVTVSLVASGSVSAAPSASPSSGSDEGASSTVVPALLFTVLAAVLAF